MKKRILIVDNCLRLWNEITSEFGKTIDEKFIPNDQKSEIDKEGFMRLKNNDIELCITCEMQTTRQLIEMQDFDMYFLDNQIYDSSISKKILGQNQLVKIIKNKTLGTLPIIYNISSHENSNGLNRCPKRGKDIMYAILGADYEK